MFSIVDYYNYVTTTGSGATGKLLLVLLQVRQTFTDNTDTANITIQREPLEFRRQSILWMPSIVRG